MSYAPIIGTLAYVLHGDEVLMVHRIFRADDDHLGKYNGLGGKLTDTEDVVSGMQRELREEAQIEVTSWRLRGTVSWPGFGSGGENWLGFIFIVDGFTGEPPDRNEEGTLHWVPQDRLLELPLWEGDRQWLPLVFDPEVHQFHGVMPYLNGRPTGWQVTVV
ncbi:MAG: NUDIX hydrolase [Propioniciclava sp.]